MYQMVVNRALPSNVNRLKTGIDDAAVRDHIALVKGGKTAKEAAEIVNAKLAAGEYVPDAEEADEDGEPFAYDDGQEVVEVGKTVADVAQPLQIAIPDDWRDLNAQEMRALAGKLTDTPVRGKADAFEAIQNEVDRRG